MEQGIVAKNLYKTYEYLDKNIFMRKKEKKVVDAVQNISMSIKRGQIIGLLGINGAGKTTTIRLLSTLIEPTSGELIIDGIDAIKNHKKVKQDINIISGGERNLYWRLTAKENLSYFGSLYGLNKTVLNTRIEYLMKTFELDTYNNLPVERYSKGMKQRLQIARGLINDPAYIFLDEPTLGLDIAIAQEVRGYVKELARQNNKGILLTTHYLDEAEMLCDYVYIIDKGTIIAMGTIDEIKAKTNANHSYVEVICSKENNIELLNLDKLKLCCSLCEERDNIIISIEEMKKVPHVMEVLQSLGVEIKHFETKEKKLATVILDIISESRGGSEN